MSDDPEVGQEQDEPTKRDLRSMLSDQLDALLTEEQIRFLVEEVLASQKKVNVQCPKCNRFSDVLIPDAKAVVPMLGELLTQAKGRPGNAEADAGPRITFTRTVIYAENADG